MKAFPDCFITLFVTTGDLTSEDVCEALYTNSDVTDIAVQYLHTFVQGLDKHGEFQVTGVTECLCFN